MRIEPVVSMRPAAIARVALVLAAITLVVTPISAQARRVITIPDVAALYKQVNDVANEGALLILTSSTPYKLTNQGVTKGRIELQKDMALQGLSMATTIDASALDGPAYSTSEGVGFKTGAVRLGRGSNALTNLTITNATAGASAITTDLPGTTARITITNVVASNSQRGLDIRNYGAPDRTLDVTVTTSHFVDNLAGPGQGIRIANIGSDRGTLRVTLSANDSYGNVAGCLVANLNSTSATISIRSSADSFDGNSNGCVFIAGLHQDLGVFPGNVNANRITVDAYASRFSDNTRALPPAFPKPGGVIAIGGQNSDASYTASNNTLAVNLYAAAMGNNQGSDITAYGAYSTTGAIAGTYNAVTVRRIGTTASYPPPVASEPPESVVTNVASVTN